MPLIYNVTTDDREVPRHGRFDLVPAGEALMVDESEVAGFVGQTDVWALKPPKSKPEPAAAPSDKE